MARTAEQAFEWALQHPTRDGGTWSQWCQSFIVRALGLRAAGDANVAFAATKLAGKRAADAPVGALHWWLHPSRSSGHVGISFGGSRVLMTDAPAADQWGGYHTVGMTTVERYNAKKSGYLYQGWSTEMAGQKLRITSQAGTGGTSLPGKDDDMVTYELVQTPDGTVWWCMGRVIRYGIPNPEALKTYQAHLRNLGLSDKIIQKNHAQIKAYGLPAYELGVPSYPKAPTVAEIAKAIPQQVAGVNHQQLAEHIAQALPPAQLAFDLEQFTADVVKAVLDGLHARLAS